MSRAIQIVSGPPRTARTRRALQGYKQAGVGLGAFLVAAVALWWAFSRKASAAPGGINSTLPLSWPALGPITSPYGKRASGWHNGVDIAVQFGSPIYAPADGVVTRTWDDGPSSGGYSMLVQHPDGVMTGYAHLMNWAVVEGDEVKRGDVIAYSGGLVGDIGAGHSTGPHLHFTVRINGVVEDPASYLPVS